MTPAAVLFPTTTLVAAPPLLQSLEKPVNGNVDPCGNDVIMEVDMGGAGSCREEVVCQVLRHMQRSVKHSPLLSSEAPTWLLDIARTQQLVQAWKQALPRVRPFYAVKCNGNALFLQTLASLGTGFDCASKEEIHKVLRLGVPPSSVIFANACKLHSDIMCAAANGIQLTTFDNEAELQKICTSLKGTDRAACKLLLRIATDDEGATLRMSSKYGARMEEVGLLLQRAAEVGLAVVGVAFHIGSGTRNPHSFNEAIRNARHIFDLSAKLLGAECQMRMLDIGGGFCSSGPEVEEGSTGGGVTLQEAAPIINQALNTYFPISDHSNIEIIAEPGRYFACSPFTLVTRVFGKRVRGDVREYWINDGAHQSFTMILLPHNTRVPPPIPFTPASLYDARKLGLQYCDLQQAGLFPSTVFGPTCSGLDELLKGHPLPELETGDLLAFPFMGAYTHALATQFNGFSVTNVPVLGFIDKSKTQL